MAKKENEYIVPVSLTYHANFKILATTEEAAKRFASLNLSGKEVRRAAKQFGHISICTEGHAPVRKWWYALAENKKRKKVTACHG